MQNVPENSAKTSLPWLHFKTDHAGFDQKVRQRDRSCVWYFESHHQLLFRYVCLLSLNLLSRVNDYITRGLSQKVVDPDGGINFHFDLRSPSRPGLPRNLKVANTNIQKCQMRLASGTSNQAGHVRDLN